MMRQKRDHMRMLVRAHSYCKFRTYQCGYQGKDRFGKVAVTSLSNGTAPFSKMVLCDLYEQIAGEFAVVDFDVELEQQDRIISGAHGTGGSVIPKNVINRLNKMGQRLRTLAKTMTSIELDRAPHEKFVSFRVKNYVERYSTTDRIVQKIKLHAKRIQKKVDPRRVKMARANNNTNTTVVLLGEPGSGKTSMMCHLSRFFSNDFLVVTTIVGNTARSTSVAQVMVRIINEIQHRCSFAEVLPSLVQQLDFSAIKSVFGRVLNRASSELGKDSNHLVILIDGIEQFGLAHSAHLLDWVFPSTPTNCSLILSCTLPVDGDSVPGIKLQGTQHSTVNLAFYKSLAKRNPQLDIVLVDPLSFEEANAIQRVALRDHSKKLNATQIKLLLNKHDATKPLFIMCACEELIRQGQYGIDGTGIDEVLISFPSHMSAMFTFMLVRLEKDMEQYCNEIEHIGSSGKVIIQESLVLLTCSRNGCSEQDLLQMVGINQAIFARLYNGIWQYLRPRGTTITGGHNLAYFQRQLSEAVYLRYVVSFHKEPVPNAKLGIYV